MTTENNNVPRILIVDDNFDMAEFVVELLEEIECSPVVCHSGNDALKLIERYPVNLILLDVVMPDSNGFTVAKKIKEYFGAEKFIPIIMLSALTDEKDKSEGLNYADDYVTKPFGRLEFLARVKSQLRNQRIHEELRQSRQLYLSLYDNVPYMYVSLDAELQITNCNVAFAKSVGLPKTKIIGCSIFAFINKNEEKIFELFIESIGKDTNEYLEPIFTLHTKGEAPKRMTVNLNAVYSEEGEYAGGSCFVIAMQDITRKLTLEAEQKAARKMLYRSARLASLGTLAQGVAHEINNPLTAINGFADSILKRIQGNESVSNADLVESLDIIKNEAMRCRKIIADMSDFAYDRDLSITNISLLESINSAMNLLESKIKTKNCVVKNTITEDMVLLADSSKLGQVLLNVITNALDFLTEGGVVTIGLKKEQTIEGYAILEIEDDGAGIAPDIVPKVFDPFFTTKEVGQGTGLGLAICHSIMREFNGTIDLESELGKGTKVILYIPRAEKKE